MADSSPLSSNKPHSPVPTKPPKSKFILTRYIFSKSLIVILVLLVFFYFPSQVPEMFKETTIVTKLWELIYLLVIGIAACYGLFSRKIDNVHSSDESSAHTDDTYLSGISHISSIFEDGVQNSYGFEEKSLFEEVKIKGSGSRFSEIGDGFGKKMNQSFLGESLFVINDEKYVLEQLGRQYLGSKSLDSGVGKSVVGGDSSSSGGWEWDGIINGKFRGVDRVVPVKLEEKFRGTDSDSDSDTGAGTGTDTDSRTLLNKRSKSMRLEKREDSFANEANEASHFTPLVGNLDFEANNRYKMKNLSEQKESKVIEANNRYKKPFVNNETSFMESKPQDFNVPLDGSFEEIMKDFGKLKVDDGTFVSRNKAQFVRSKSQSSSNSNPETFKSMLGKGEKADVSNSIPKPATIANTYRKGKSVRTNRLKEQVLEANVRKSQTDDIVEMISKPGIDATRTNKSKEQVLEANVRKSQTDDKVETVSKPEIDAMNVRADDSSDTGEVDRKAEEFIAKFREQIRLQKVASARKLNLL